MPTSVQLPCVAGTEKPVDCADSRPPVSYADTACAVGPNVNTPLEERQALF